MKLTFPSRLVLAAAVALAASLGTARAAPAGRHVTLLHVSDTHAQLETHPEYVPGEPGFPMMGGFARLKTAVDRARADVHGPSYLVDGGDTFQGSGPAAWSHGEVVVKPLNALGIDVGVPGNWEVAYGSGDFERLMSELSFPEIAYNFQDASGRRLFPPAKIFDRGGVKVAFVGVTDPTTTIRQPPAEVVGLDSTRVAGLRAYVQALKAREHPDLTVLVDHTGLSISRALAREIPELDVVLSGHTHERTETPILEGRTLVVEPGSMGSFLGRLDLTVGAHGGVKAWRFRLLPVRASEYPEDPKVAALVEEALAPYRARADRVVGHTRTPILRYDVVETTADDLVADAVREITGADVGFTNGFRFGTPIPPGPVTEGDLWNLLPTDAHVKEGWVTGKQLRAYMEEELELVFSRDPWKLSGGWGPRASGLAVSFVASAPPGHRVRSLRVHGREVRDDDRITIAGCERDGEPMDVVCRLHGAHDARRLDLTAHDVLERYFARHGTVAPRLDGRAVARDLPEPVWSQDAVIASFRRLDRVKERAAVE